MRMRRAAVILVCVTYVAISLAFGVRHLLGDSSSHPTAYFFTWDMFPGYATESSRRSMLGATESGRHVRLLPAANHHFRWGIHGNVQRIDVDRRPRNSLPQLTVQKDAYNKQHPEDPIINVVIADQYWPAKFNLPDDIYESHYGQPNPHRKYWRIVESVPVDDARPSLNHSTLNSRLSNE